MARITRVQVTPDGRTVVVNHRRMSGFLLVLDWNQKRASDSGQERMVPQGAALVGR